MAKMTHLLLQIIFVSSICWTYLDGRIHTLQITNDNRKSILLTRFGFLQEGHLSVSLVDLQIEDHNIPNIKNNSERFGFTLAKTASSGVPPFVTSDSDCPLSIDDSKDKKDGDVSVIYFPIILQNSTLLVFRRGDSISNLTILKTKDDFIIWSNQIGVPANETYPQPVTDSISMTKIKEGTKTSYKFKFYVYIENKDEEGLYSLYFHNCANMLDHDNEYLVNFTAELIEDNHGNYLSAGQMALPTIRFVLCTVYVMMAVFWIYILRTAPEGVYKLHYLMFVLLIVKALAVLFHGLNSYFIQKLGHHEEALAVIYYITYLMRGILLFVTIVLIGAGWAFVKYILSERDKKIFIIVIPLQILANVAQIIIEETEEGESQYATWGEILILVDLLCCGAILFPVVWSIRHLQEASQIDGKAAISLAKLKIFRHFYILIVCYIYFTRIIVYLLTITMPFHYEWINEVFREIATVIFFSVTGYKFRPMSNNPYLQVPTSDDEAEMDEVVTKSGMYENLTQVNQKHEESEETPSGLKQRENSHEYD